MSRAKAPVWIVVALIAGLSAATDPADVARAGDPPAAEPRASADALAAQSGRPVRASGAPRVGTIARGLEVPWEIAFLPDGRALISERPGRVRLMTAARRLLGAPAARVPVLARGEGGLLGVAVDPEFRSNRFVYLYRTADAGNEILRYRMTGSRLAFQRVVATGVPRAGNHDGGRIHIGPDGWLYVSTGDASQPGTSQNPGSLAGKILRISPPAYRGPRLVRPQTVSRGHRNPQGFDWQPGTGRLVATEHGPQGFDEVNIITRGGNYGWPTVFGTAGRAGLIGPVALYQQAIAPSGATFVSRPGSAWTGDFMFGALRGEQVRRVRLRGGRVVINQALFAGRYGRLRTVVEGPDGALYALTNNRDGRGTPRAGDDRVLRIVPPAS